MSRPREVQIQVPEQHWYQFIDWFTRMDEQLDALLKLLSVLNNNIATLASILGATYIPSVPQIAEKEVRITGPIAIQYQAVEKISSRKLTISDGAIHEYEISPMTDIIKIYVEDGAVQYDVRNVTTDSDKIPAGSTLIWRVPRGRYNKLYIMGASGTGTPSTLYISEWMYSEVKRR